MALLTVFAIESFAAERFACSEYFAATPAGQKKAEAGVKGTLVFDPNSKKVEFLNPKGARLSALTTMRSMPCNTKEPASRGTWRRY
jgi:hypothetical protein